MFIQQRLHIACMQTTLILGALFSDWNLFLGWDRQAGTGVATALKIVQRPTTSLIFERGTASMKSESDILDANDFTD